MTQIFFNLVLVEKRELESKRYTTYGVWTRHLRCLLHVLCWLLSTARRARHAGRRSRDPVAALAVRCRPVRSAASAVLPFGDAGSGSTERFSAPGGQHSSGHSPLPRALSGQGDVSSRNVLGPPASPQGGVGPWPHAALPGSRQCRGWVWRRQGSQSYIRGVGGSFQPASGKPGCRRDGRLVTRRLGSGNGW